VRRHDYVPFGEELGASVGGRTTGMGFSSSGDNNRKKFTGYERDTETGLDFAQARFYGSTQGRFTSSDPFSASAIIADPQTFNRFAYCRNNPVNSVDPSGMAAATGSLINMNRADGSDFSWSSKSYGSWSDNIAEDTARHYDMVEYHFSGQAAFDRAIAQSATNAAEPIVFTGSSVGIGNTPQNSETAANLADRAAAGLSNHPGLLEQIQSNTASGVDVHIVACQAAKESNYANLSQIPIPRKNAGAYISGAVGSDGEIGLLQIFPSTAGVSADALKNVGTNVKAATSYLMGIKNHFNVGMREALAIYNWGPGNFNKVGRDANRIFSGSLSYADKILDCSRRLYLPSDGNQYKVFPR
jgi:RHS repeat-associated protein